MDPDKIAKNPGVYQTAKLKLNSFWVFFIPISIKILLKSKLINRVNLASVVTYQK